jgi:NADH-quinone oxidoreductase subunit M
MISPDAISALLPVLLALPIVGVVAVLFAGNRARLIALVIALVHLVITGVVCASACRLLADRPPVRQTAIDRFRVFAPEFVPGAPAEFLDLEGKATRPPDPHGTSWEILPLGLLHDDHIRGVQFYIGLDGLNIWLVALTSFMLVPVILVSWESIRERPGPFYAWLFFMQACLLGVFLSFDIIVFYVCFELTLIPLFFLIGGWGGGASRREAARKLFLYTLTGGLITLLGIAATVVAVYNQTGILTFSIPELVESIQRLVSTENAEVRSAWQDRQTYLFLALAAGFAVKTPLVPFHSWLPAAYSEGPIGVTVMLAALLAKMGVFGLLRLCLPLAPDATLTVGLPVIGTLAAIGIIYGALCAYGQPDFKRLVAYSSVSHLGFCALALVAFNAEGISGAVLHMINHGLSTGMLFLLVGLLLERYTSGQIADFGGLWGRLPVYTLFMMIACLASIGLPGLCNFVSEMIMLAGLFDLRNANATSMAYAVAAAAGIFLSAWYTLTMVRRAFFGPVREPAALHSGGARDLNGRELLIAGPLAALCLAIGLMPQPLLDAMRRDVNALSRAADDARARLHYPTTSLGARPPVFHDPTKEVEPPPVSKKAPIFPQPPGKFAKFKK